MNSALKSLIGIFVSVLAVYYILINYKIDNLSFHQVDFPSVLFLVSLLLMPFFARTLRWDTLLNVFERGHFSNVLKSSIYAASINAVIPGRIGDLYKCNTIAKVRKIKFISTLFSLLLDKLFDFIVPFFIVLTFYRTNLNFFDSVSLSNIILRNEIGFQLICLMGVIVLSLFLFPSVNNILIDSMRRICIFFSRSNNTTWFRVLLFSVFAFVLDLIVMNFLGNIIGLELDSIQYCFIYICILLSLFLPSSPGNIGTFHFASLYALSMLNQPTEIAISFTFWLHLFFSYTVPLIGIIWFVFDRARVTIFPVRY